MRTRMTNKRYNGVANVLPDQVATWEAAGWVADEPKPSKPKKTSITKGDE